MTFKNHITCQAQTHNKQTISGDYITGTDFLVFETIDKYTVLEPTIIEDENLKNFMQRIRDLPTMIHVVG